MLLTGTLGLDKAANVISAGHGDTVTYSYAVTFTPGGGPTAAAGASLAVTDNVCSPVAPVLDMSGFNTGDTNQDGDLNDNETWQFTCAFTIPAHGGSESDPIVNNATVTGNDTNGDPATAGDDSFSVDIEHTPGTLSITKSANVTSIGHGGTVNYSFAVSYTPGADGSPAQNVAVIDGHCQGGASFVGGDLNSDGLLDAGETWNFACSLTVAAMHSAGEEDPIENSATATASDLDGDGISSAPSNMVSVDITHDAGALTINKSADRTTVPHGGVIAYTFHVTYAPGADGSPASNIAVTDSQCDQAPAFTSGDTNTNNRLDSGETWMYSCSFTVTAAHAAGEEDPITNSATVAGQDLDGQAVTGDTSNTVSVDVVHGTISGRKFVDIDGNAMQEATEPALAGVTINLFRDANGSGSFDDGTDTLVATQMTDATGNYTFGDLVPGTYFIRETVPANFVQTTPARMATITAAETVTGQDFGNQPAGAALIPDPCDSADMALLVVGTVGSDEIMIRPGATAGSITVERNRTVIGTFMPTGHIIVHAFDGSDRVTIARSVTRDAIVRGGGGNDNLKGGSGADAIIGDAGSDVLNGGRGRDVLIGGVAADRLVGGPDDDILVAGNTDLDANDQALCAILAEWTSTRVYGIRIRNLEDGTGSTDRLNGTFRLNVGTAHNDAVTDFLTGSAGDDWFLLRPLGTARDRATDRGRREFVVEI